MTVAFELYMYSLCIRTILSGTVYIAQLTKTYLKQLYLNTSIIHAKA